MGTCRPPPGRKYAKVQEYEYDSFAPQAYPFSATHPLLFHVLTGAGEGEEGQRYARHLLSKDVELIPAAQLPGIQGLVRPRDRAAGDDQYVFLTALSTFGASESITASNRQDVGRPAFAFDAETVWRSSGGFGFRVRDLEDLYLRIEPPEVLGWMEEFTDEEWEEMSDQEREDAREEATALAAADDLECMADAGTIHGPGAWEALSIYAARAGGLISPEEAVARGMALVPDDPPDDWCPWASDVAHDRMLRQDWEHMFTGYGNPRDTIFGPRGAKPEVLVRGRLPLRCASWYRDARGVWHPMSPAMWGLGQPSGNPRPLRVTPSTPQR